jgi:hypothetical protein
MGHETAHQFREFEFDIDTSGPVTFEVFTELPGSNVASRYSATINTETTTTGRATRNVRVPISVKGKLSKLKISGSATINLYGVRAWARPLGTQANWNWYSFPVVGTQVDWSRMQLPIVPTQEGWNSVQLPIAPTEPEATWITLPVDSIE